MCLRADINTSGITFDNLGSLAKSQLAKRASTAVSIHIAGWLGIFYMATEVSNTNLTFHHIFISICFSKQRQSSSAGSDISCRGLCCVEVDIPTSNQTLSATNLVQ